MKSLYHESDRALFVFYHKKGCSICSVFQPILERVIKEYSACGDALHYVSLDIYEEEGIPKRAGITGVPATQVYYKGKLLDMVPGVHSKKWLRKHINGILEAYGEPHVREWAHERLAASRKEEFYTSTIFRKAVEALKDGHVQQVRMQAPKGIAGWQGLGARGRGALGECSAVCSAVCDGERNNVRKFLPAFQPAAKPAWENCIDSFVIEMT